MAEEKTYREKLMDLISIQLQSGTDDQYMNGLTNGIILALAVYTNTDPQYVVPTLGWKK